MRQGIPLVIWYKYGHFGKDRSISLNVCGLWLFYQMVLVSFISDILPFYTKKIVQVSIFVNGRWKILFLFVVYRFN